MPRATLEPANTGERLSYEEFLAQADEDVRAEWVNGKVVTMSPASARHQQLGDFLLVLLKLFVEKERRGNVLSAPFQMKLGGGLPGREPDLLFLANEHLDRLQKTHLRGPADLVVEIVSPESRQRDHSAKFDEYQAGGVEEYWILDPDRETASFFVLADGRYLERPTESGVYRSAVLDGFRLRVDWLWQDPPPPLYDVLRALDLL